MHGLDSKELLLAEATMLLTRSFAKTKIIKKRFGLHARTYFTMYSRSEKSCTFFFLFFFYSDGVSRSIDALSRRRCVLKVHRKKGKKEEKKEKTKNVTIFPRSVFGMYIAVCSSIIRPVTKRRRTRPPDTFVKFNLRSVVERTPPIYTSLFARFAIMSAISFMVSLVSFGQCQMTRS